MTVFVLNLNYISCRSNFGYNEFYTAIINCHQASTHVGCHSSAWLKDSWPMFITVQVIGQGVAEARCLSSKIDAQ